jgi:hypothetical protein
MCFQAVARCCVGVACTCYKLLRCSGAAALLQVTDAQLQVGAVPGSRYKFKPSSLAGTAAAAGLSAAAGASAAGMSTPGSRHQHHQTWPPPQFGASAATPAAGLTSLSAGASAAVGVAW